MVIKGKKLEEHERRVDDYYIYDNESVLAMFH